MKVVTKYPVIIDNQRVNTPDFYVGFDAPKYFNGDGGMEIFTTYPVIINQDRIDPNHFYLNADGEQYLPFDGKTNLLGFCDENGVEYYCSIDGEEFYNAKGEKVIGFFKKVGKGVVKAGKFVGKVAKKVGRALAQASKKVAKGVKKVGGKVKQGAKKLIHHKKKDKKAGTGSDTGTGAGAGSSDIDKFKAGAAKMGEESPDPGMSDVFTQKLKTATPQTPPDKVLEVAGKKYSTQDIPAGKEVVQTTDENGQPIAGVEYAPSEVVAVTGADGNIEYHTPDNVSGMSTGLKIALFVGGGIALAAILYLALRKKPAKS